MNDWLARLGCRIWRHQARLYGLHEINCARCGWWKDSSGEWVRERPNTPNPALHPHYRRRFLERYSR